MNWLRIAKTIYNNPYVLNPHIKINRIDEIDYNKLKELGIKYIVFDKDNTLTGHLENNYFDKQIQQCIECEVIKTYDMSKSIFIVSNSIKTQDKQKEIQNSLGLNLILTNYKKPFNYNEIINYIKQLNNSSAAAENNNNNNNINNNVSQIKNHEIAFVGDRLLTDVYLANTNGSISIYTKYFNNHNESIGITLFRIIENQFIHYFSNKRNIHLYYFNKGVKDIQSQVIKQSI